MDKDREDILKILKQKYGDVKYEKYIRQGEVEVTPLRRTISVDKSHALVEVTQNQTNGSSYLLLMHKKKKWELEKELIIFEK